MLSAIYVLDHRGKTLISRDYRGDVPAHAADRFLLLLEKAEIDQRLAPVLNGDGCHYLYIRNLDVYLVAVTRSDANSAAVLGFLNQLVRVLQGYCGELREESIRDNFSVVYELLDEMMDFGYPQITDQALLRHCVTQRGRWTVSRRQSSQPAPGAWRSEGIRHGKNQLFLDVVESVNVLVNSTGQIVSSEILGSIQVKCALSGMPELQLGLDNMTAGRLVDGGYSVGIEDIRFHQCVRQSRGEDDGGILFEPPDGEFELMSYRLVGPSQPPIMAESLIHVYSATRIRVQVRIWSLLLSKCAARRVLVEIPVARDAVDPRFKASSGSASYAPDKSLAVWQIKQLCPGKECSLEAQYTVPRIREGVENRRPLSIHFEVPSLTVSGIQVRHLRIAEKSGYKATSWVRYMTQSGDYHVRLPDPITV